MAVSGQGGKGDWFKLSIVIVGVARKTKTLLYGRLNVAENLSATGLMHLASTSHRPNIFMIEIAPDIVKFTEPYVLIRIFYIFCEKLHCLQEMALAPATTQPTFTINVIVEAHITRTLEGC